MPDNTIRGRFAPSPSGRLHLGNVLTFLLAWLDVRARGGTMVFRLEDLGPGAELGALRRAHGRRPALARA
ncbi:MAG: glutamate--tRNA ligase family protein [Oscillospiraceae bacterium]